MKKNEELFCLIKAMSKSEKRNFKLESGQFKSDSSYMRLFDAIDAMDALEEYDESRIKEQFKNQKSLQQFHVLKNYLKQAILKSLRSFHAKRSKQVELNDCLSNLNILFNKELFQLCDLEIKKAERIARDFDLFAGLNEVQGWKRKLAQNKNPADFEKFRTIIEEQADSVSRLNNQHNYYRLITDITENIIAEAGKKIENEILLEDIDNATSFESGVIHYNARYFRAVHKGKAADMQKALEELLEFFEDHESKLSQYPGLYISSMNNACSYFVFSKMYDKALNMIERLKKFYLHIKLQRENITLLKQALRMYHLELEVYRLLEKEELHSETIKEIADTVERSMGKMPESYLISFWFQLANIYFAMARYKTAMKYINKILDAKFGDTRPDIQLHARILNLMVHFELNNVFVLRYFVESARRIARKANFDQEFIKKLLSSFSKLGRVPTAELNAVYLEMRNLVEECEELTTQRTNLSSGYINYERWLATKF